jgi:hypothetical protein
MPNIFRMRLKLVTCEYEALLPLRSYTSSTGKVSPQPMVENNLNWPPRLARSVYK